MNAIFAAVFLAVAPSPDVLGQPLRQDGYTLRPPAGFRLTRMDLFHNSRVGAVGDRDDLGRRLSAALVDSDSEDAASLLVAMSDRPFKPSASAKDELSAAVVKHFSDELQLTFAIERSQVITGAGTPRVEVRGTVRDGSQLRQVVVTAFAGELRHAVVTASVPSGRWEALSGPISLSLETFKPEPNPTASSTRTVAMAVAALLASALLFSVGLWRRRRALLGERTP